MAKKKKGDDAEAEEGGSGKKKLIMGVAGLAALGGVYNFVLKPAPPDPEALALVRAATGQGAQVVLIQELFAAPYFCIEQHPKYFELAQPLEGHPLVARFAALARELGVVIPVSFFERAGPAFFNSVAMVDADGRVLGNYR